MSMSDTRAQTLVARRRKRKLVAAVPKPKLRKPNKPYRRKNIVRAAIPGTRGIWSELARKLDTTLSRVQSALDQEGWEDVREAFEQEKLKALDRCVRNIHDIADNSPSDDTRRLANQFILQNQHPDYHPESKVVVEGGKPIQHQHKHIVFQIPAEIMTKSVEDRLAVLEAVEVQEKEMNGNHHSD